MAKFTIIDSEVKSKDVDEMFSNINTSQGGQKMMKLCENIKGLVSKNSITPDSFKGIIPLKELCNYKKYHEFLLRRNNFLKEHQIMDANQFSQLFWNEDLKNKEIDNYKDLISWKFNKADINQWELWICVFETFLKQLKETPFFETLIRCSLKRNENNDWWKCLIPLCNKEWHYEYIDDEDIKYLKNSKIWWKELISNTSLWFNILETLLVKMVWDNNKYKGLAVGYDGENFRTWNYNDLKTVDVHDLKLATYWIVEKTMKDTFLWKGIVKHIDIKNFEDEDIEWLINLSKTWIIKLNTWLKADYEENMKKFYTMTNDLLEWTDNIDEYSNEKIINERWYTHKILHNAWPNEEISVWEAKDLWTTFKIKWTNEWFVPRHAYSIENMHKKDGDTFVTIINPRYTWKKIDIPLKYVKEFFKIWIDWYNIEEIFS